MPSKKQAAQETGLLYPSVAVSDTFNAISHFVAAYWAYQAHSTQPAFLGFGIVAIAATIGVGRFGFSEKLFIKGNEDFASLAAYLGLPLVGLSFALRSSLMSLTCQQQLHFAIAGACMTAASRSLPPAVVELSKVLINLCLFLGPIGYLAVKQADLLLGAAVFLFAFAGVVIKPERHSRIFGVRREDLFHYCIGLASLGIAKRF